MDRTDYYREYKRGARFRKWIVTHTDIDLATLSEEVYLALYNLYVDGLTGKDVPSVDDILRRARRMVDECDFTLGEAVRRSVDIERLIADMKRGVVEFSYLHQASGEERHVRGTLSGRVAPYVRAMAAPRASALIVAFWNPDEQTWMGFSSGDFIGRIDNAE